MSEGNDDARILATGKLPPALLARLIAGERPPEVLLAPAIGEDAGAVALAGGALIAASDPVTLTGQGVGAHAVVVNANDIAVMGVRPRWFVATVLLPEGTSEGEVVALFAGMHECLDRLGVSLISGHTEVTASVRRPVVVGTMLGFAADGRFVRTGGLAPGDVVLQIGPAPVEAAAVLAAEAALGGLDAGLRAAAARALDDPGIAVIEPALCAAAHGAVAMHDPTEGGLSAGLHEMAEASGCALVVDGEAVLWFAPGVAAARVVGANPWGVLASGTLLAGFRPGDVAAARAALAGFAVAPIAVAEPGAGVRLRGGGALARYDRDEVARVLSA